ncbi:MAG: penicillin-binding protein 2 [Dehalococcoidia bacterium]|jgi:penicillin-binding protein 2|nr:penicillin-binding protein 2 [Dehalococcoidia bacterium]
MSGWDRLSVVRAVGMATLALLAFQLARIQLFETEDGIAGSSTQVRTVSVEAPRGLILDRNGVPLARNIPRFSIVAVPGRLPAEADDRRVVLFALERETGVPIRSLEQLVAAGLASSDPFAPVTVRRGLEPYEAIAMRAALAALPGVEVWTSASREYEGGDLLPRILGYVGSITAADVEAYLDAGYPLDARVGRTGIELEYEALLRGQPGQRLVVTDFTGRELRSLADLPAQPGADLTLSIDLRLQDAVERALSAGIEAGVTTAVVPDKAARAGAAVVIDVRDGAILALVSLPSYDVDVFVNSLRDEELERVLSDPARPLVQRAYMEVRPPGSTFKPVTGLAALQEGVATPDTRIVSRGQIVVQDEFNPDNSYVYKDWAAHGSLDFYGGIAASSDVYYYYLSGGYVLNGRRVFDGLGPERLARYARSTGMGQPTGLDLPGEAAGLVPDPRWKQEALDQPWVLGDTYTFGIGQGFLTVTPLQMAVAVAAIANGGDVLTPHVVQAVTAGDVTRPTGRNVASRLPIDEGHLEVMREAMRQAAAPGGTARGGQPAGTTIGGKTGTAEFGPPLDDGEFETHAWFVGFAPYEQPEIAIAVFLQHGNGSGHAAPVAHTIFEAYSNLQARVVLR